MTMKKRVLLAVAAFAFILAMQAANALTACSYQQEVGTNFYCYIDNSPGEIHINEFLVGKGQLEDRGFGTYYLTIMPGGVLRTNRIALTKSGSQATTGKLIIDIRGPASGEPSGVIRRRTTIDMTIDATSISATGPSRDGASIADVTSISLDETLQLNDSARIQVNAPGIVTAERIWLYSSNIRTDHGAITARSDFYAGGQRDNYALYAKSLSVPNGNITLQNNRVDLVGNAGGSASINAGNNIYMSGARVELHAPETGTTITAGGNLTVSGLYGGRALHASRINVGNNFTLTNSEIENCWGGECPTNISVEGKFTSTDSVIIADHGEIKVGCTAPTADAGMVVDGRTSGRDIGIHLPNKIQLCRGNLKLNDTQIHYISGPVTASTGKIKTTNSRMHFQQNGSITAGGTDESGTGEFAGNWAISMTGKGPVAQYTIDGSGITDRLIKATNGSIILSGTDVRHNPKLESSLQTTISNSRTELQGINSGGNLNLSNVEMYSTGGITVGGRMKSQNSKISFVNNYYPITVNGPDDGTQAALEITGQKNGKAVENPAAITAPNGSINIHDISSCGGGWCIHFMKGALTANNNITVSNVQGFDGLNNNGISKIESANGNINLANTTFWSVIGPNSANAQIKALNGNITISGKGLDQRNFNEGSIVSLIRAKNITILNNPEFWDVTTNTATDPSGAVIQADETLTIRNTNFKNGWGNDIKLLKANKIDVSGSRFEGTENGNGNEKMTIDADEEIKLVGTYVYVLKLITAPRIRLENIDMPFIYLGIQAEKDLELVRGRMAFNNAAFDHVISVGNAETDKDYKLLLQGTGIWNGSKRLTVSVDYGDTKGIKIEEVPSITGNNQAVTMGACNWSGSGTINHTGILANNFIVSTWTPSPTAAAWSTFFRKNPNTGADPTISADLTCPFRNGGSNNGGGGGGGKTCQITTKTVNADGSVGAAIDQIDAVGGEIKVEAGNFSPDAAPAGTISCGNNAPAISSGGTCTYGQNNFESQISYDVTYTDVDGYSCTKTLRQSPVLTGGGGTGGTGGNAPSCNLLVDPSNIYPANAATVNVKASVSNPVGSGHTAKIKWDSAGAFADVAFGQITNLSAGVNHSYAVVTDPTIHQITLQVYDNSTGTPTLMTSCQYDLEHGHTAPGGGGGVVTCSTNIYCTGLQTCSNVQATYPYGVCCNVACTNPTNFEQACTDQGWNTCDASTELCSGTVQDVQNGLVCCQGTCQNTSGQTLQPVNVFLFLNGFIMKAGGQPVQSGTVAFTVNSTVAGESCSTPAISPAFNNGIISVQIDPLNCKLVPGTPHTGTATIRDNATGATETINVTFTS